LIKPIPEFTFVVYIDVMLKSRLLLLLLVGSLQGFAHAQWGYGDRAVFHWADLDSLELPVIQNWFKFKAEFTIEDVPPGWKPVLEGPVGFPHPVEMKVEGQCPSFHFTIVNVFGYADSIPLEGWAIVFKSEKPNSNNAKKLPLTLRGTRQLPQGRVGEVIVKLHGEGDEASVTVHPQLQLVYPDGNCGNTFKPLHFRVDVETLLGNSYYGEGWYDGPGPSLGSCYRSPGRPQHIPLKEYQASRYIKITFNPVVKMLDFPEDTLRFEPGTQLSFWWDTVEQKRVEL
jgi:hypothetical protein